MFGRQWLVLAWSALAGSMAITEPVRADEKEPVTLDAIARAWQQRQDKVKSARFVWKERRTDARGSHTPVDAKDPTAVRPPTDITYETEVTALVQGDALRVSYTDQWWSPALDRLKRMPYLGVFDGRNTYKRLRAAGIRNDWPEGSIKEAGMHPDAMTPQLRPILMTCQARNPRLRTYDIEQFSLTGKRAVIGDHSCVELVRRTQTAKKGPSVVHLWVDPLRDFVIVRDATVEGGILLVQLDVQFQPHGVAGWVPQAWAITNTHPSGNGKFYRSTHASVTEFEFNVKLQRAEFDIEFPPGTLVLDNRTGTRFIVGPDGRNRYFTDEEWKRGYEAIVTAPAWRASAWPVTSPWALLIVLLTLASGVILAWRLWSRWRRTPAT